MSTPSPANDSPTLRTRLPEFGFADIQEARFAKDDLDAEQTGVSHHRLKPKERTPFGHRHEEAEEVYVVLSGSGRVKLDDEIVEVETLDAIPRRPQGDPCLRGGSGWDRGPRRRRSP